VQEEIITGYYEKPAPVRPVAPIPIDELEPEPPVLEVIIEPVESRSELAENKEEGEV